VVKRDCPTCLLVVPVLAEMADAVDDLTVVTQDDPTFPETIADPVDDTGLDLSYTAGIQTVPTLLVRRDGREVGRAEGWDREIWSALVGIDGLGDGLPPFRPGCGSLSVDPTRTDDLRVRHEGHRLRARRLDLGVLEDEVEGLFSRGWTDGLPVVPPTPARVLRMLDGTSRSPQDLVAIVPPDLADCTVEKVAINAVMAGCTPEHLPVVLAAVEAICTDEFNIHGLLCTTMPSAPVIVVNGPIARAIGMNSGLNVLGQGNRANTTIGRAVQLVVRNVGGGRPGEIDRATMGSPAKIGFCFAEDEGTSPWEPLSVARGMAPGTSAVTLFPGEAPRVVVDQLSRTPQSLAASIAACLQTVAHPKIALMLDAMLVVSPEHARVFAEAGWTRQDLADELDRLTTRPGEEMVRGAGGIAEGMPAAMADQAIPKLRPGGLLIVHAGGPAGLFSAIIGGWVNGAAGSDPVTVPIEPWT
jgi:thiol-disulfide isomerase/thioredoxin